MTFADLARELAKTYRRVRKDAPEDWRAAEPEVLHELRSRVVAHRYQMELVEPLWPKFGRVWVAEAQRLRDRLGSFQDFSVLQGFTRPHAALAPWRSRLVPLILARQATHAKAAQRIGGRLLAEKPRAFRRRLEALWEPASRVEARSSAPSDPSRSYSGCIPAAFTSSPRICNASFTIG